MPKRSSGRPEGTTLIQTYDKLGELVEAFANGKISLLVLIGPPGLSKSQTIKGALARTKGKNLYIKGKKTPLDFYCDLYTHQDYPVTLDDTNHLLSDKLNQEIVRALTETDKWRKVGWGSKTKILEEEGVPPYFYTTSPVCICLNWWVEDDPLFEAHTFA